MYLLHKFPPQRFSAANASVLWLLWLTLLFSLMSSSRIYAASESDLAPPTGINTSISGSNITVSWNDNAQAESGYRIERRTGLGAYSTIYSGISPNQSSYTDGNLASGSYIYRIYAVNASGSKGLYSAEVEGIISAPKILAPDALSPMLGTEGVTLSWTDTTNDESGFDIERRTGSTYSLIYHGVTPNETSFIDRSLPPGTYIYHVRAYKNGIAGLWSNEARIIKPVPLAPTELTATLTENGIQLKWTENAWQETGYKIERKTGSGTFVEVFAGTTPDQTSYLDSSAILGSTYSYRVRAYQDSANGLYSNTATVLYAVPAIPSGFSAKLRVISDAVLRGADFAWKDNSTNEDGFRVYAINTDNSHSLLAEAPTNSRAAFNTNLNAGTIYRVVVVAFNLLGESAGSNIVTFTTPAATTPTATPRPTSTPAPLNGQITFSRDNEVFVMNADGSQQKQLTYIPGLDTSPALSADGSKIVWCRNFEIYVMNSDSTQQVRLTNDENYDYSPTWSSDGTKIAWASLREGSRIDIYVMNSDGSGEKRLTTAAGDDETPSFSPDGNKIVFSSTRDGNREIYVMNSDGSNQTRLTNSSFFDIRPRFSPDGSKIAFQSDRGGLNRSAIWVMNADGSNPTNLTPFTEASAPTWSPDGTRIAGCHVFEAGTIDIMAINTDGSNLVRLTSNSGTNTEPYWGPGSVSNGPVATSTPQPTSTPTPAPTATPAPPPPPSNFVAVLNTGDPLHAADLSWDKVPEADNYGVYYHAGDVPFTPNGPFDPNAFGWGYSVGFTSNTLNVADLLPDTLYTFFLTANRKLPSFPFRLYSSPVKVMLTTGAIPSPALAASAPSSIVLKDNYLGAPDSNEGTRNSVRNSIFFTSPPPIMSPLLGDWHVKPNTSMTRLWANLQNP